MTHRRVSAISRARTADDTSLRTRRNAFASATYQTSSSVGPVRNGYWSIARRSSSRLPKQGISSPARAPGRARAPPEAPRTGSARAQRVAISVLRQVRMAPEDLCPLLDRLVERQVLERVQRVVMDEDRDRPLRGQDVRGMPDHLLETMQPGSPILTSWHTPFSYVKPCMD